MMFHKIDTNKSGTIDYSGNFILVGS